MLGFPPSGKGSGLKRCEFCRCAPDLKTSSPGMSLINPPTSAGAMPLPQSELSILFSLMPLGLCISKNQPDHFPVFTMSLRQPHKAWKYVNFPGDFLSISPQGSWVML